MKGHRLRIAVGMAGAMVAVAATVGGGPLRAHAAGSLTISPASVNNSVCHNLNPDLEVNRSALTAVPDNTRGYVQFSSLSVSAAAPGEAAITVNLCGAVPSFPPTNGDTGAEYDVCFSPSANEPIESGRWGNVAGYDPVTGAPIFDGPYPKSQGWRLCAWASINAGAGVDYGVAVYDPIGYYVRRDPATLFDGTPANPTITPTTLAAGVTSFTMYLPSVWVWTVNGGLPNQTVERSTVLNAGEVSTDWVAASSVTINGGRPEPVCTPATDVCAQGIFGVLIPVDFAPGYEQCSAPLQGCAQFGPLGFDLGVENDFPVSSIPTCVNPVNPPGNSPLSPLLTCDEATFPNTPLTGGPPPQPVAGQQLPYSTTLEYGRILPGPVVPFEGYNYQPFGSYVDDGLTLAA